MRIVYYVNSHGFGHAKRSAAIIMELLRQDLQIRVEIRTKAARSLFPASERISVKPVAEDFGIREFDALNVDAAGTVHGLFEFMKGYGEVLAKEVVDISSRDLLGIVSDISFLAGDVAGRIGVPCVGVANFTWDWILEPQLKDSPEGLICLEKMRSAYRKMGLLLKAKEFSHDMTATFEDATSIIETPLLVCERKSNSVEDSRQQLSAVLRFDISRFNRGVLYYDIRGLSIPWTSLKSVTSEFPDILFLVRNRNDLDYIKSDNLICLDNRVTYDDAFNSCSILVSKLGYCTVVSSIAESKRLLFPTRHTFREDDLLRDVTRYIPANEMSPKVLREGRWQSDLSQVLSLRCPSSSPAKNGAEFSAGAILGYLLKDNSSWKSPNLIA